MPVVREALHEVVRAGRRSVKAETDPQLDADVIGMQDDGGDKAEMVVRAGSVRDSGVGDHGWGTKNNGKGQSRHYGFADNREADRVIALSVSRIQTLGGNGGVGSRSVHVWMMENGDSERMGVMMMYGGQDGEEGRTK